jgi:hypothetical protein
MTGVRFLVGARKGVFSSPSRPDRLLGTPTLLYNGYQRLFPRALSDRDVKLTTHLHLVLRLIMHGTIPLLLHTSFIECYFLKHTNKFT